MDLSAATRLCADRLDLVPRVWSRLPPIRSATPLASPPAREGGEEMSLPKIFVFVNLEYGPSSGVGIKYRRIDPSIPNDGDCVGVALAEDGTFLSDHFSSSRAWFRHDMGLTSDRKHDVYKKHYPDGYELIEVADPANHTGLMLAASKSKEQTP
jgi:hypothetical protein